MFLATLNSIFTCLKKRCKSIFRQSPIPQHRQPYCFLRWCYTTPWNTAHTFPEEMGCKERQGLAWMIEAIPVQLLSRGTEVFELGLGSQAWTREERMGRGYPIPDLCSLNSRIVKLKFKMKVTSWTAVTFSDKTHWRCEVSEEKLQDLVLSK